MLFRSGRILKANFHATIDIAVKALNYVRYLNEGNAHIWLNLSANEIDAIGNMYDLSADSKYTDWDLFIPLYLVNLT